MLASPRSARPTIGVTVGMRPNIVTLACLKMSIWLAGGRPVILRPSASQNEVRRTNGLVISGGSDIDPARYGEQNTHSVNIDTARDAFELRCIQDAFLRKTPVLGICRGGQMINISQGGTLYQDAPSAFEGFVPTDNIVGKIISRRKIFIREDSRLGQITDHYGSLFVNSIHHQAHNVVGPSLHVVAEDALGLPQAVEGIDIDHFVLGVQWHPEFMLYSPAHLNIFRALVTASRTTLSSSTGPMPVGARRGASIS